MGSDGHERDPGAIAWSSRRLHVTTYNLTQHKHRPCGSWYDFHAPTTLIAINFTDHHVYTFIYANWGRKSPRKHLPQLPLCPQPPQGRPSRPLKHWQISLVLIRYTWGGDLLLAFFASCTSCCSSISSCTYLHNINKLPGGSLGF